MTDTINYIILGLLFALVVILTVRREVKRHKEHKAFMANMQKLRERDKQP